MQYWRNWRLCEKNKGLWVVYTLYYQNTKQKVETVSPTIHRTNRVNVQLPGLARLGIFVRRIWLGEETAALEKRVDSGFKKVTRTRERIAHFLPSNGLRPRHIKVSVWTLRRMHLTCGRIRRGGDGYLPNSERPDGQGVELPRRRASWPPRLRSRFGETRNALRRPRCRRQIQPRTESLERVDPRGCAVCQYRGTLVPCSSEIGLRGEALVELGCARLIVPASFLHPAANMLAAAPSLCRARLHPAVMTGLSHTLAPRNERAAAPSRDNRDA